MNFTNNKFNKQTDFFGFSTLKSTSFFNINNQLYMNGYKQYTTEAKYSLFDVFKSSAIYQQDFTDMYFTTLDYSKEMYSNHFHRYHNAHMSEIYRRREGPKSTAIMNMPYEMVFNPNSQYNDITSGRNDNHHDKFSMLSIQYMRSSGTMDDYSLGSVEGVLLGRTPSWAMYYTDSYTANVTIDRFKLFKNQLSGETTEYQYATHIAHMYNDDQSDVVSIYTSKYSTTNIDRKINTNMIPIIQTIDPVTKVNNTILFNYNINNAAISMNLSKVNSISFDPDNPDESIFDYSEYTMDITELYKPANLRTYISNMLKSDDPSMADMREIYLPLFSTDKMIGYSIHNTQIEFDKLTKNISSMIGREDGTTIDDINDYYVTQVKFNLEGFPSGSWIVRSEFLNLYCTTNGGYYISACKDYTGNGNEISFQPDKTYTITSIVDARGSTPHVGIYVDGILIYLSTIAWSTFQNQLTSFRNINLEYFYFTEILRADAEAVGITSMFGLLDSDEILKISERPYDHNPLFLIYLDRPYTYTDYLDTRYDHIIANTTEHDYSLLTILPSDEASLEVFYDFVFNATPSIIKFKINLEEIDQIESMADMSIISSIMNTSERYVSQRHSMSYTKTSKMSVESMMYEYEGSIYYIHNLRSMNRILTSLYKVSDNNTFILTDQADRLHNMLPINMHIGNMYVYSDVENAVYGKYIKPIKNMNNALNLYETHGVSAWSGAAVVSNYVFNEGGNKPYTFIIEMGNITTTWEGKLFTIAGTTVSIRLSGSSSYIGVSTPTGSVGSTNISKFEISDQLVQVIAYIDGDDLTFYVNNQFVMKCSNPFKYISDTTIGVILGYQGTSVKAYQIYESIVSIETIKDNTISDEHNMLLPYDEMISSPLFDDMNIVAAYDFSSWSDLSVNGYTLTGATYSSYGVNLGDVRYTPFYADAELELRDKSGLFRSVVFTDKIETNPITLAGKSIQTVNGPGANNALPLGTRPIVNSNEIIFYDDTRRAINHVIHTGEFRFTPTVRNLDLTDPSINVEFPQYILDDAISIYDITLDVRQVITSMNIKSDFIVKVIPDYRLNGYIYDDPIYIAKDIDDGINPIIPAITFTHSWDSRALDDALASNIEDDNIIFKNKIMEYIILGSITALIDNEQGIGTAAQLVNDISTTIDTDIVQIVDILNLSSSFNIVDSVITFSVSATVNSFTSTFKPIGYQYRLYEERLLIIDLVSGHTNFTEVKDHTINDRMNHTVDNNITLNISYVAKNAISETPNNDISIVRNIEDDLRFSIDIPRLVPDLYLLEHSIIAEIPKSSINQFTGEYENIVFRVVINNIDSKLLTHIESIFKFEIQYSNTNAIYGFDFNPCDIICNSGKYYTDMISDNEYIQRSNNITDLYLN